MLPNNSNLKNSKVQLVEYYERPVMGQGKWIGFFEQESNARVQQPIWFPNMSLNVSSGTFSGSLTLPIGDFMYKFCWNSFVRLLHSGFLAEH